MKNHHLLYLILIGEFCLIVFGEPEVIYYVKSTLTAKCPGLPCETLNYYLKNVDTTINLEKNLSMIFLTGNHSLDVRQIGLPFGVIQTPVIRMVGENENVMVLAAERMSFILEFDQNYEIYLENLVLVDFYLTTKSNLPKSTFHMSSLKLFDVSMKTFDFEIFINNSELTGGIILLLVYSVLRMCKFVQVEIEMFSRVDIDDCTFLSTPLQVFTGADVIFTGKTLFAATKRASAISSYFGGNLTLSGTVTFANNSAVRGGALALYMSTVNIAANTNVTFLNNSANHKGGAIYVEPGIPSNMVLNSQNVYMLNSKYFLADLSCFYQLLNCTNNTVYNFHFADNSAIFGGNDIYGVSLSFSCNSHLNCDLNVNISSRSNSSVSSDALRVCICDSHLNGQPQCKNNSYNLLTAEIHSGEAFKISAVLVGGDLGLTTGTIYANIYPSDYSTSASIALTSEYGNLITDITQCHEVEYSLYSQNNTFVAVFFTAVQIDSPNHEYPKRSQCNDASCFQIAPVYINFTVLPCPPGFNLTGDPPSCDCYDILTKEFNISCQIINGDGYFSWTGDSWVNILENNGALYSKHCPHNYCKIGTEKINLRNNSAYQCDMNRKGQLCGECMEDYSLAIGSSWCVHCTNDNHFALIIFFAAAGFSLVLLICLLNLTVTSGTINGLIFYANIIWTYKDIFFTREGASNAVLKFLKTFIAWVNLDFGIETCFVKGLTAFWKTWLQFVFPFYIWAIAGLIILASRYSFRLTKLFGNRAVPLLATLLLLSYMKLLRTVVSILEFSIITRFEYPTILSSEIVWSLDGRLSYFAIPHIFLLIAGLFILLFLWLPYTLLLFLMQWLRRLPHVGILKWIVRLHPLYDSYFAPLKPKHQYWFGVLLLARGILLVTFASNFSIPQNINLLLLVISGMLLIVYMALANPYKSRATLLFNGSFIINLTLLSVFFFFTYTRPNGATLQSVAVGLSAGLTFLQFCGTILISITRLCNCCLKLKTTISLCSCNRSSESLSDNSQTDSRGFRESILNETEPLLTNN